MVSEQGIRRRRSLPGLRVIVSGKGGVGKTTITALLATSFTDAGFSVLAVDADPQEDLAYALGCSQSMITPVTRNRRYISEKIGGGGVISLTPDLSDVASRCGVMTPSGIRLLVMGTVESAGTGCLCPENSLIRGIVRQVKVQENEAVLMDTPAGFEHLGRGLGKGFSHLIAVTEPTERAIRTAYRTAALAADLGISDLRLAINKVRSDEEYETAVAILGSDHPFSAIYRIPYTENGPGSGSVLTILSDLCGKKDSS
ncbi:ATP-binding protein [Methanocalculus chunghsingensis]|uniref:ATP-binding protein n=1 Tax=Methanocalculus chunghsingensis TaxID=156457 RepID=UPI001B8BE782|nr:AAA family ATPase [Methanocalculus chunghsingensis]